MEHKLEGCCFKNPIHVYKYGECNDGCTWRLFFEGEKSTLASRLDVSAFDASGLLGNGVSFTTKKSYSADFQNMFLVPINSLHLNLVSSQPQIWVSTSTPSGELEAYCSPGSCDYTYVPSYTLPVVTSLSYDQGSEILTISANATFEDFDVIKITIFLGNAPCSNVMISLSTLTCTNQVLQAGEVSTEVFLLGNGFLKIDAGASNPITILPVSASSAECGSVGQNDGYLALSISTGNLAQTTSLSVQVNGYPCINLVQGSSLSSLKCTVFSNMPTGGPQLPVAVTANSRTGSTLLTLFNCFTTSSSSLGPFVINLWEKGQLTIGAEMPNINVFVDTIDSSGSITSAGITQCVVDSSTTCTMQDLLPPGIYDLRIVTLFFSPFDLWLVPLYAL